MTLLVDTSVWSLLLRRDTAPEAPEVELLVSALQRGERVATTGLIVQELLQGRVPPKIREGIVARFAALLYVEPTRDDYIAAADLANTLRAAGIQVATVDALLAQIAIAHGLVMLSADRDFELVARHTQLRLWRSP